MIPILICNRDLLTSVQSQVSFFQQIPEAYITICDCASTYPLLVEWYKELQLYWGTELLPADGAHPRERWRMDSCPEVAPKLPIPNELILFPDNRGPRATQSIIHELPEHDYYFMSDADINYSGISPDFLDDLRFGLDVCPEVDGVGVSLRIDDLPDTPMADYARHVEAGNWGSFVEFDMFGHVHTFYHAPCDTAGVLRRSHPNWLGGYSGLRSVKHIATHLPWHFTPENTPEDFKWFYSRASARGTSYTSRVLDTTRPL